MNKQQINIKLNVLKETVLSAYSVVQPSIGKNSIKAEKGDVLIELHPMTGLTLVTSSDETTVVKNVGVKIEAYQPEDKQTFLVDPFLFDGHLKNINSDMLTIMFDGKYLNIESDNKQSKFLTKNPDNFFNRNQSWQDVFSYGDYIKLPVSLLYNLHKAIDAVKHTTIQDPTQLQKNCIELSRGSVATTDNRGHSLYSLGDSLPIPNDDKLMMDKVDYTAIEKVILNIVNSDADYFYISFYYDKEKQKITYMFIKDSIDDVFCVIHFLDLLPLKIEKRVKETLDAPTISSFSIDFDEWCRLIKMYLSYEKRAMEGIESDSFTKLNIDNNELKVHIKIEDVTEFNTQIPIELTEGEPQLEMYVKATQLFKVLSSLKGTHKLNCIYKKGKNNRNLLVLLSENVPSFKYFIQV